MPSDLKKVFDKNKTPDGFIKTTDSPIASLTPEQKVILNRKGNMLFNEGDIQNAKRLFITTGYSDGLTRVGDVYQKEGDILSALRFYLLAHNKAKTEQMYKKIADNVSFYLKQKD